MSVIYVMVPAALLMAAAGVIAFIVSVRRGQFDDLDTPASRAVFDDDDVTPTGSTDPTDFGDLGDGFN